jgi:hypothetical protein
MLPDVVYELTEGGMFLLVLLVTGLFAFAIDRLIRWRRFAALVGELADLSPVLQALCGTMFVLAVTFLASAVWQTEHRARESVNEEARNLRIIRIYTDSMSGPAHDGILKLIKDYAQAVQAEWPVMIYEGPLLQAEQQLAALYRATILGFAEGELNRTLQQRLLTALDGLSQARQERLTIAQDHVSGGQWFIVAFMALLLLAVIAICHAKSPHARAVALSIITLAISISLFVILAHDWPFVGRLAVTPAPILEATG